MKGRTRSGSSTGRTEKSRVSPRCLTPKDKGDGTKGTATSMKRKVFDSKKEKKRSALKFSDVESSEHLLVYSRRKSMSENNKDCNGHIFLKKNNVGCSQSTKGKRVDGKRKCSKPVKRREEAEICGEVLEEAGRGRKRSRLDVFDYKEDDGFDMKKVKEELLDIEEVKTGRSRRSGLKPVTSSVRRREVRTGCNQCISVDKKKCGKFDETENMVVGIKRETDCSNNKRCGMNKDEMFQTVDKQREKFRVPVDEPIRLSGSKGALRTMLNSKKQVGRSRNNCGYQEGEEHRKGFRLADTVEGETHVHDSLCSKKKHKKAGSFLTPEKNQPNSPKISNKNRKACNLGTKASNTLSVMGKKKVDSVSITGRTRKRENITPPSKILPTAKHKKWELKRGIATEKQLIREQIKGMVLSAGWTIDYRPRREKDYHDAVYVSPTGATYWSAVYAYGALRKQFAAEGCDSKPSAANFSFTPISDEILSKLTRKRQKNIEKEKKKTQINGNEEKIISLTKNGGKSLKVRTNEKSHVRREKRDRSRSQKSTGVAYATGEILHQEQGYLTGTIKKGLVKNQQQSFGSNGRLIQGRKGKEQTGCALLVRSSNNGENSDTDDFIPYTGKLTLLSWLIDSGSVPLSGKVQYKKRRCTRVMMEGQITRDGIHCDCCSETITVSKFEIHAGSKLQQPFQNIYVETGNSLLKCQLDAWNKQEESKRTPFHFVDFNGDDPNDDTCGVCGDGGVLICCDGCPSTFHQSCLDMEMLPSGVWHCPNCSCKFCTSTVDGDVMTSCPLLTCSLCQTKYHLSCVQEADARYGESNISCTFCGQKCGELLEKLQKLLGIKHELEAGFSWTLIQRTDVDSDSSSWELPQRVECNSKLAIALAVMDECFLPIIDRRSGINLIHNVVYNRGSNFSRLNYSGFYTVVLERGDEIISAASIRIHGNQFAEMPFIGTRHIYRRQGMFRRLLSAIEMALHSLNVEKLIIPAISELMHTWTVVFGFKPLEESHKQEMRSVNMLVFPGTGLLQKLLLKRECTEGNLTRITGVNPIGPRSNHQILLDVVKKSDTGSSDEGVVHDNHLTNDEVAAEVSGLQEPHVSFQDNSDVMSNLLDAPHEAKLQVSNQGAICCKYEFQHEFTESATDTESPIHSGLSHDNNLEIRNDSVFHAHVEFNNQSSAAEGAVDDACEVNVEPDISFDENNTNMEINEYTNDVSGPNNSVVDEGTVQIISCMNHHNDVERKSSVVSHVVFNVVYPEENILHASDESAGTDVYKVRTESNAVEPGLNAGTESYGHQYTGIAQSKVAPSINGFCGSDENNACHDSEDSDRLFCDTEKNIQSHDRAASNDNFQGCGENLVDHDSKILLKVPECLLDVKEVLLDTHEPKSEVASSECIPQAVREESVEHGCEVVSKSFFPTNFIFPASAEVKISKFLSKSCNDSPDVVELPISNSNSFHHGIHHVVDDSCDCKCILLDKHCSHLCGRSVHCTSNTTSESNFQASNGFCDSES